MVTYTTCPSEYRGKLKVFLIPWGHIKAEFESVHQGWKTEHFLNFNKPTTPPLNFFLIQGGRIARNKKAPPIGRAFYG